MKISDAANLKLKFKNLFAAFFLSAGGNSFPSPSYKTMGSVSPFLTSTSDTAGSPTRCAQILALPRLHIFLRQP